MIEMTAFFIKNCNCLDFVNGIILATLWFWIVNGFFGSNVHTLPWPTLAEKQNELNPFREFTKGRNTIRRNICQELSRRTFQKFIK